MSQEYYEDYYSEYCIKELAKQCAVNGMWDKDEAENKARFEQKTILAEGVKTKGNYLYTLEIDNNIVGEIWFGDLKVNEEHYAFIFDIHINNQHQGRGYGSLALIEIEKEARKYKYKEIRLQVFRDNERAIRLYKKNGYRIFLEKANNIWMNKELG